MNEKIIDKIKDKIKEFIDQDIEYGDVRGCEMGKELLKFIDEITK